MELKIGNRTIFDIAVKDSNNALVTNLATLIAAKFMIKENATDLDNAALVSKNLTSGIVVDTPSVGYLRITIDPADTLTIEPGEKFVGLQIEYSSTNKIEVDIYEKNLESNKINIIQDVIR